MSARPPAPDTVAQQTQGHGPARRNPRAATRTGLSPLAERVGRWRRVLLATLAARSALVAAGAAGTALAAARLINLAPGIAAALTIAVSLVAAWLLWRRAAPWRLTVQRTALWIEERTPELRYALVSAVDDGSLANPSLERAVHAADWEAPARSALRHSLILPTVVALAGVLLWVTVPRQSSEVRGIRTPAARAMGAAATDVSLGAVRARIVSPAYSGVRESTLVSPALVRALPGSRLELSGATSPLPTRASIDGRALPVTSVNGRWSTGLTTGAVRALLTLRRTADTTATEGRGAANGGDSRLIALEPLPDSAPVVSLRTPARDSVLRAATGALTLTAEARDDYGLASASFEYIVSSGEGERFTFKSGTLGASRPAGARTAALRAVLRLESLGLSPGDVLHIRAVARDRNNITGPGIGSSDSRAIRIARAGEYDSVAVDQAAPPEVDKSILSQRMLINLTEALVKRARTASAAQVTREARQIGRDQARLRRQVSDIIFARLGDGGGGGEHSHGDGHDHTGEDLPAEGMLTPEQLLKAAEKATAISGNPLDFEHDESPVVAINRPMLEAYNAMWDAGRALDGGEPRRALPPMYRALAAIQRARNAERIYLRGMPPRVVIDLQRVRMQGKERGDPTTRSPRAPLDTATVVLVSRLGRAIETLLRDPGRGIDSLVVLRLAVVERHPAAARALEAAAEDVRASRDATTSLLRARRALDDGLVARDSLSAWGSVR